MSDKKPANGFVKIMDICTRNMSAWLVLMLIYYCYTLHVKSSNQQYSFFFFFFFSSTTLYEFWLAQLFLSIVSSLAPSVNNTVHAANNQILLLKKTKQDRGIHYAIKFTSQRQMAGLYISDILFICYGKLL
jgi:branched-subunit amino acid transport protein AzlD